MRHLAIDVDTVPGKIWARWAKGAEDIGSRYVCSAFNKLGAHLSAVAKSRRCDDVHAVLALAGADVGDHEATMRLVEGLVRKAVPKAGVALVGPENFRNLSLVMRHITEQLMSGCTRPAAATENANAADLEEEVDESEWPEDLDARQMQRASLSACSEKLREHGSGGPVVLLVERMESVPKDTLRDTLTSLGMALSDENIPLFVIFGLQHPPQDCFDLFEGRPLVNLRLLDSAQLFDARSVSAELLEWLLQDSLSVMALPYGIMDWLRKDRFEYSRQSVSHVLKSLALLCVHFCAGSPCAALCAPIDDSVLQDHHFNKALLTHVFEQRLEESQGVVEHFRPLWEEWSDAAECSAASASQKQEEAEVAKSLAKAASDALCWRQRLIASLGVWDALCKAMQPMARHEPRLRRLGKLLEFLERSHFPTLRRPLQVQFFVCLETESLFELDDFLNPLCRIGRTNPGLVPCRR
jgi:hypothetical protein